jgi:Flp pilus assembly protein TadG
VAWRLLGSLRDHAKRSVAVRLVIDRLKEFSRDQRGNFAIMFAILGTSLLLGTALSIDVARMFMYQNKLTFAVDAAALATTQGLTLGDIELDDAEEAVRKYLDANLDGRNLKPSNVMIDGIYVDPVDRTVQIDAHTLMPTTLAGVVGYDNHKVAASTKAKFSDTEVEVAIALDITGSMSWNISYWDHTKRITALKSAAELAITTLFTDDGSTDRIRVGLVPYSTSVNVTPILDKIEVTPVTACVKYRKNGSCKTWDTFDPVCVHERTGPQQYTDAFADSTAKIGGSNKYEYTCPSAQIEPLTENEDLLKNRISALTTGGNTAGHIAIAWAYYMLSSKWNAAWPDESDVQDFDYPGVRKYAIIMTDGAFNTFESEDQDGSGATNSSNYAKSVCTAMKNSGIKIYSIAFGAGTTAANLMKDCANTDTASSQYFYNTTSQAELEAAFKQIAADIKGLRLIN